MIIPIPLDFNLDQGLFPNTSAQTQVACETEELDGE